MNLFGFDPGGYRRFGWAVLSIAPTGNPLNLKTGITSYGQAALDLAYEASGKIDPLAVGIDSPMFWVEQGDRYVDTHIRKRVCAAGGHSGTVSHVNSLRGACLVQGILTARKISERWPEAKITEAHPKALLLIWAETKIFLAANFPASSTEHERDAAIAAYSAWAMASNQLNGPISSLGKIIRFFLVASQCLIGFQENEI
jgi:hypothetical protein